MTLDTALAAVPHEEDQAVVVVGADQASIWSNSGPPKPGLTYKDVANAFGMTIRNSGSVRACGPANMTVLNTNLSLSDGARDLQPRDALVYLAATLNEVQWRAFTSAGGLGIGDLTSDEQVAYFNAVLPTDMKIAPRSEFPPKPDHIRAVSDRDKLKLRLSQTIDIYPPSGTYFGQAGVTDDPLWPRRYTVVASGYARPGQSRSGVVPSWEVPNAPKPGDLDLRDDRFDAPVGMKDIDTVAELTAAVSKLTNTEIYADARYEPRSIHVYGGSPSLPARDLLGAVAFGLTATFRKVGPAFVLTDDIAGVGTRKARLRDIQSYGESAKYDAVAQIVDSIKLRPKLRDLPFFEIPLTPSAQEIALLDTQANLAGTGSGGAWYVKLPFSSLTAAQQAEAMRIYRQSWDDYRRMQESAKRNPNASEWLKQTKEPTLNGDFQLQARPVVSIIAPLVDGPIVSNELDITQLYNTRLSADEPDLKVRIDFARKFYEDRMGPVADLKGAIGAFKVRAAYVRPENAKQLDQVIAAMTELGFNQLWLDFFSDGTLQDPRRPDGAPADLLAHAVARARDAHIAVLPVFSLFCWGENGPKGAADLNIHGETTRAYADRLLKLPPRTKLDPISTQLGPELVAALQSDWVSPSSAAVQDALTGAVSKAVSYKGLDGLVFRDTMPNANIRAYTYSYRENGTEFGYSLDARLAYLRKEHADPIDIVDQSDDAYDLPQVDGDRYHWQVKEASRKITDSLSRKWNAFRTNQASDFLASLAKIADDGNGTSSPKVIYIRQASAVGLADACTPWTRRVSPTPTSGGVGEAVPSAPPNADGGGATALPITVLPMKYTAEAEYNLSLLASPIPDEAKGSSDDLWSWLLRSNRTAPLTARRIEYAITKHVPKGSAGIVLDLTPEGGIEDGPDKFIALAMTK